MTNTATFAKRELDILNATMDEPIIAPFYDEIISIAEKFGQSGQSGSSAPYTASALATAIKKLCLQEPIAPITGDESEWANVSETPNKGDQTYQNIRCAALFKDPTDPYYLEAILWRTPKGMTWGDGSAIMPDGSRVDSCQYVKSFPFTPKTFIIDVIEKEIAPGFRDYYIKYPTQLEEVFQYYNQYNK